MNPIIDEIEKEFPDVLVDRVNIDEKPEEAEACGVMSIPAYLIIKSTDEDPKQYDDDADSVMEETHRFVGAVSKQTLIDALKND